MRSTIQSIEKTLREIVDRNASVRDIKDKLSISPFLLGSYQFYRASALGKHLFIVEPVNEEGDNPKRLAALADATDTLPVLFLHSATKSQKRSLIKREQGFITKSGDLYLPELALALTTKASKQLQRSRYFTPGQQQAFLYCLFSTEDLTQEGLKEKTGMSPAEASRALRFLADEGLIDYEMGGKTNRKKTYFVLDKAEFYRKGKMRFGNPIKFTYEEPFWITLSSSLVESGLSALASRSDLVPPAQPIYAQGPKAPRFFEQTKERPSEMCTIQKLSYNPLPFADKGMVDPFTMLMTIDEDDERISIALRNALKEYSWYQD